MTCEYSKCTSGRTYDVLGIFEKGVLVSTTHMTDSAKFIQYAQEKKPKTVQGAKRILSTYLKEQNKNNTTETTETS